MPAPIAPGKNIWMVVHEHAGDIGSYGTLLNNMGIRPTVLLARETNFRTLDAAAPDVLIVMGGPMGVYEAPDYAWMTPEIGFISRRIAADKPLLGVCLGSQMIAHALGSKVFKGPQGKEIGWHNVAMNAEGLKTPLLHLDESRTPVTHWHGDTFDLPAGATLLGSSKKYENQAYRYGRNVIATQFHPEVNAEVWNRWMLDPANELPVENISRDALNAEAIRHGCALIRANSGFFTGWLADVSPRTLIAPPVTSRKLVPGS